MWREVGSGIDQAVALANVVVAGLDKRGECLAVAESLTGGALAAMIVSIPGASHVFRGAAVTYATDTKTSVLGVDAEHLACTGPVDPCVAEQMASGVAQLFGADYALATTGVAGPGGCDGCPAGTVYIGVVTPTRVFSCEFHWEGDRDAVRCQSVIAALELLIGEM